MPRAKLIMMSIIIIFIISLVAGNIFGHFMIKNMTDVDGFSSLGRQFADYGDLGGSIRRGPIYPVFLGSIYRIFEDSRSNVIFFQSVILGILGVSTFIISYEHFQSNKIPFLTGICTVLHPMLGLNSSEEMYTLSKTHSYYKKQFLKFGALPGKKKCKSCPKEV